MNSGNKEMKLIVNVIDPEEMRIAILDERGRLDNLYIERMLQLPDRKSVV